MFFREISSSWSRVAFSMLEVMVAMTIFTIAAFGLLTGVATSHSMERDQELRSRALDRLSAVLDTIRSTDFAVIATTYANFAFDVPGLSLPDGGASIGRVTVDVAQSTATLIHLTVLVQWKGQAGATERISVVYRHANVQ